LDTVGRAAVRGPAARNASAAESDGFGRVAALLITTEIVWLAAIGYGLAWLFG
jgi:hypothetical protein